MKRCSTCKIDKPFSEFCKNKAVKDGFNFRCKDCSREYDKQYNEKNREARIAYKKKYRAENAGKIKEYCEKNKEKQKLYQIKNKNHLKEYRKNYYLNNATSIKTSRENNIIKRVKYLLATRKIDAAKKGFEFSITVDFVILLFNLQNGKCAITGIPFDMSFSADYRTNPFSPSVDRKDSKRGYSPDNVQVVCHVVNMAKSEYPQEIFDMMCKARMEKLNG